MRVISTTGTRSIFCTLRENGNLNNYTVYVTNESTNVTTTIDITQTPIQITSNTISFKNRLNDKLINYEINIEFSNNTINNIR